MGKFFLETLGDYGVNNLTVILMGIGVVFAGLIILIIACSIMGAICKKLIKQPAVETKVTNANAGSEIQNKDELIAAISCAIAEASGTDAKGLKIVNIVKK